MARPTYDLQSHSTCSDGALVPEEVVARAAAAGVELLALTDHDTVDGVAAARRAAAVHGIGLVSAVELSSVHATFEDLHVLGYGIDPADATFLATLADWRADRQQRILAMAARLEGLGWALDRAELEVRAWHGHPLGRPHLATALLTHASNAARLAEEGIGGPDELFPAYLVPGAPGYVARTRPTVGDAIAAIHEAGGVAVWAHPFWDVETPEEALAAIDSFAAIGLDGVECLYATHTREQAELLHAACLERGLLITGSADFHGPEHGRFSRFRAFEDHGLAPRLGPIADWAVGRDRAP